MRGWRPRPSRVISLLAIVIIAVYLAFFASAFRLSIEETIQFAAVIAVVAFLAYTR